MYYKNYEIYFIFYQWNFIRIDSEINLARMKYRIIYIKVRIYLDSQSTSPSTNDNAKDKFPYKEWDGSTV